MKATTKIERDRERKEELSEASTLIYPSIFFNSLTRITCSALELVISNYDIIINFGIKKF